MARKPAEDESIDLVWPGIAAATLLWVAVLGWHYWWRGVLLSGLALAAFMLGCAGAFVFSSYGEEANSIGKIKDWIIGGLAGLTIAEFSSIKPVLMLFAASNSAADYALVVANAIIYLVLGFLFMFLKRELILNVMLARGRATRQRIEGNIQAGKVALDLIASLPPPLLAGQSQIEDLLKQHRKKSAATLKQTLQSPNVQKFLDECDEDLRDGLSLDWDIVSKVAYIRYFRTYFSSRDDEADDLNAAFEWIRRALVICPQHIDLTCKLATIHASQEDYAQTIQILENLRRSSDCPLYVDEWLGFYLLYFHGREDESIRCTEAFLAHFPASNEARRNLASAYAQKACLAARSSGHALDRESLAYREALKHAATALQDNEPYRKTMQTVWIGPEGSFSCFAKDPGYLKLVGLPDPTHTANTPTPARSRQLPAME